MLRTPPSAQSGRGARYYRRITLDEDEDDDDQCSSPPPNVFFLKLQKIQKKYMLILIFNFRSQEEN